MKFFETFVCKMECQVFEHGMYITLLELVALPQQLQTY